MLIPVDDLFSPRPDLKPAVTVMDAIGDLPPVKSGECAVEYTKEPETDYEKERRNGCKELTLHYSTRTRPKCWKSSSIRGKTSPAYLHTNIERFQLMLLAS